MPTVLEILAHAPASVPVTLPAPEAARFFAQGELPLDALAVEVDGFGPLAQPLPAERAQALQALSAPARFGRREQTLLDTRVRHTGEIDADRLALQWPTGGFARLQQEVARALGVEQLDAALHNLLIYGAGQFFKPHQDTERHPRMVATLVLVWPSAHLGGDLRVTLGSDEGLLASQHLQAPTLRWFAFYADCRHEVLPVSEGWRVVLTFDLMVPAQTASPRFPPAWLADLQAALQLEVDAQPEARAWVLLLDHEYTEHGLRWPLLKGDDRWRVAALRTAAQALGLQPHLALAELHETWNAQPVFRSRVSRSGRTYDEITDEVSPQDLIDAEMTLDFWVDTQDRVSRKGHLTIDPQQVLSFVATGEDHRTAEEYEGYMGNYGDTLDYWYRRAALVIRSPLAEARDAFTLDFDAALAEARRLAADPAQAAALTARVRAADRALQGRIQQQGRALLEACMDLAVGMDDVEAAVALLLHFDPTSFLPEDAATLARLARSGHGSQGLLRLLQAWYAPDGRPWYQAGPWRAGASPFTPPSLWPADLAAFVTAAQAAAWPAECLTAFFRVGLVLLARFHRSAQDITPAQRQALQPALIAQVADWARVLVAVPTQALLPASATAPDVPHPLHGLIDAVLCCPLLYPLADLVGVVQACGPVARTWPPTDSLAAQVQAALRAELDEPPRAADDHRLRRVAWTCRCKDCAQVIAWAEEASAQPLVLSMAEQWRVHVQQRCEAAGAGLSFQTVKQGLPYKLVLSKPRDLHLREQLRRTQCSRDHAMLARAAASPWTPATMRTGSSSA